jgi:hypothetical integral membrane protein (TIGR02206 family)
MFGDSLDKFSPYGVLHFGALVTMVVIGVCLGLLRRKVNRSDPAGARMLDWQFALVVLAIWIISQGLELLPWRYKKEESLPIHFCDIVAIVAAWGVYTSRRLPRAVLYYWGLALSTQALIQPELAGGPATVEFWVFWVPHSAIISAVFYDLIGRGYQPTWRDYFTTIASLLLYLAIIIPLDLALRVNYGFVGNIPHSPLEFLGPWPMRVVKASIAVIVVLAVLTAPWSVVRAMRKRRGPRERTFVSTETEFPPPEAVVQANRAE